MDASTRFTLPRSWTLTGICIPAGASTRRWLERAGVALLPTGSGGVDLLHGAGWQVAYRDPLATVLLRASTNFPQLAGVHLPVLAGASSVAGRTVFPDTPAELAVPGHPR